MSIRSLATLIVAMALPISLAACGSTQHASHNTASSGTGGGSYIAAPMSDAEQATSADSRMESITQKQAASNTGAAVFAPNCTNEGAFFSCTVAYGPTSSGGTGYVYFKVSYPADGPPQVIETSQPPTIPAPTPTTTTSAVSCGPFSDPSAAEGDPKHFSNVTVVGASCAIARAAAISAGEAPGSSGGPKAAEGFGCSFPPDGPPYARCSNGSVEVDLYQ